MLSGEATNTNFIVLDLNQPGLEPMIFHTGGKHTNQYSIEAVEQLWKVELNTNNLILKTGWLLTNQ
jgi:hypothetical protein